MANKMSSFKFQKKSVKNKLPFRAFASLGTILLFIGIFVFWYGNYYEKQSILHIEILVDDLVLVGYIFIILAVVFILIGLIFISKQSAITELNYEEAKGILDKRYVMGEISIEEYEQMKKDIEN
jgi:uncharacterized membrane protein